MNFLLKIFLLFIFTIHGIVPLCAQQEEFITDEGEVVEGEFVINKQLEISLPPAQRIFQKVPPDEVNARETEPLNYTFQSYTPQLPDIHTRLRVLKLKEERVKLNPPSSYFNIGFGNYFTPYLEAALNSGVNKTGNYGLKAYHLSSKNGPVDKENSGDSHSKISLFGKYVGSKASVSGNLGYTRQGYHFYGYEEDIEVDRDSIKQVFNDISVDFEISGNDVDAPIQYTLYGKVYNITDNFNASELGFKTGVDGKYLINDEMTAKLDIDYLYTGYKNPESIGRSLVRIYPAFVYSNFGLTLDIGMKILNNNDTLGESGGTRIFPSIWAGYELSDNITAYGKLDGDLEEVTYRSMVSENPFIKQNIPINHTSKNLDFQVGLKGSLVQYLAFDVSLRSAIYKNMYFYVNDPMEFNKFSVIYDQGNTTLFQGLLSLSYFKGKTLGTTLAARFNAYSTGDIESAWHKPKFEFDYSFWYNFYDKVKFTADLFILSGIKAPDFREDPILTTTLDTAVDLNLKVDYLLSEKYSVFVSVNNLLNNNYQVYNKYPTRGLLAILGLSVSF